MRHRIHRAVAPAVTRLIGVLTPRAGQTSTFFAVSLAWTLSRSQSVLLVDCDMEGGTIADLLYLRLEGQTIANCLGEHRATPGELEAQAVAVPGHRSLRVVPGLRGSCGYEIGECLRQLGPAFRQVSADLTVVDLGHPLFHAGLRSPRAAAEVVTATFERIFVVLRDEPALLAHAIEVLRAAPLSHGELVVCVQRNGQYRAAVMQTLQRELPELPVRDGWSWDERRAARMAESGRPMGLEAVEGLQL